MIGERALNMLFAPAGNSQQVTVSPFIPDSFLEGVETRRNLHSRVVSR
jgi:hypothetical protein